MLASLCLENWKSFGGGPAARRTLALAPTTLLVGPNGSGKSNALDALRFLQGVSLGYPLGDALRGRWEGQREVWPSIRGGVAEAAHGGCASFSMTSTWERSGVATQHKLAASTDSDVALVEEHLRDGEGTYFFDTQAPALRGAAGRTPGGAIKAALRSTGKGNSSIEEYSAQKSLLVQVEAAGRVHPEVTARAREVRDALVQTVFLDIRPSLMRDYRPSNGGHLGSSGENISPVLHSHSDGVRSDVVDWLTELCAPEIEAVDFDVTRLGEVMLFFVERGGRRTSARSASDGTLRFLGELVALLTCPPGTLVVLEEPDVGLHPSRIRLLAELLETVTRDRGIQVVATTHSPTLLAHLSHEALANVIAFGRDPLSGETVCSRVGDLEHFATLRDAKDVEHLISTGWLERAL